MVTSTRQALLAGSEIEPALFWRQRDFFNGNWWQNEEKLTRAYEMLLKESESRHMTGTTLIADYNYYDNFGYANTRVYTLQALIGAERTGIFDISTLDTLETVLISQNVDISSGMVELTPSNLKAARNWYDNQVEILKEGAYQLENGWGDILKGFFILGVGFAYRDVEVPSASKNTGPPKGLVGSDFEDYLNETIGGEGSFSVGGREFDGGVGNRWWEAKSGNYWNMPEENPGELAKFKSDMGNRLKIATENGATYELFSNTPIPESTKQWLTKKGIPFTELLD